MDDLVKWLRAQLDEDERIARAAGADGWRRQEHPSDTVAVYDSKGEPVVDDEGWPTVEQQMHITRHDPARVLRDIDAKRAIVDDLAEFIRWGARKGLDYQDGVEACERTLKRLALPYADRPGYREEWRP